MMKTKLMLSDKFYPAYAILDKKGKYTVTYKTDEFEVFSQGDLLKIKEYIGSGFTFKTNAGVDVKGSTYKDIKIKKVSYDKL